MFSNILTGMTISFGHFKNVSTYDRKITEKKQLETIFI